MTTIHDDPDEFAEDQLAGWTALYADRVRAVHGGVVALPTAGAEPQVAVVVGGGSGHYPAFCGGRRSGVRHRRRRRQRLHLAVDRAGLRRREGRRQGRGVVLSFGNYAGDTMNFGLAAERLRAEGIDTRIVIVTDDVASADDPTARRGIAGDFAVFKAMGAAAAAGADLDAVERVGTAANAATRTLGVAFSGCTMPGATEPLFTVPDGHLGLGLGIHGEPGIEDVPLLTATALAELLVSRLLAERPAGAGPRVAPILNGLGDTKYEELFLLWGRVAPLLASAGLQVVEPEVGELVTSLDMGGCSLTLQWLDDDLERWWRADAYTPAYRKVGGPVASLVPAAAVDDAETEALVAPDASSASRSAARTARAAVEAIDALLREREEELGRIDAVAGDGDHGRGMVKGVSAARRAVERVDQRAGSPSSSVAPATHGPSSRVAPPESCGVRRSRRSDARSATTAPRSHRGTSSTPPRPSPTRSCTWAGQRVVTRPCSTRCCRSSTRCVTGCRQAGRCRTPGVRQPRSPSRRPPRPPTSARGSAVLDRWRRRAWGRPTRARRPWG